MTAFGFSGVTTTTRLGFGGITTTTRLKNEDGSDHTDMLITVLGTSSYDDASVTVPDGPTVEPTFTSAISSVDNFDQAIHIVSNGGYNDSVTFSGNNSLTLVHSQTESVSFDQASLGDGTLSIQTASGDPSLDDHSLATFDESYSQIALLNSGSTTTSSLTAQTVGEETTVTLGPIAETGSSASSFDYEANGSSTFHSSETGIYTIAPATTEPPSGNPGDPSPTGQLVASPFAGLPTLTTISTSETWTDSISFSDESEYEQTISFNLDNSWSLDRTEIGSGASSIDQTLISTLTINDEVGSINNGLGTAFTFSETSNLHSWNDGESSFDETLTLVSTTATDPDDTTPPEGETVPPDNADITILLTHDENGESSGGLTLVTSGSQSYQAVGITETVVESTPPGDPNQPSQPTTQTEPVAFELATNDTWLSTLGIVSAGAYTTGLTYSSQDGLTLIASESGNTHSELIAESDSVFSLSTETTHPDLTVTTAEYQDQSTLAYTADVNHLYTLESHLAISADDTVTASGTFAESGDGTSNGTAATNGSYQTSTIQPSSTPDDLPFVSQTSNDNWNDQLTFNDLYEFDRVTDFNTEGSFTIHFEQSGSGASAFDHLGSGSSDDADETTPAETYQHHIWENSDYSYTLSATIDSVPANSEGSTGSNDPQAYNTGDPSGSGNTQVPAAAQITDFSYVSTSHKIGGAVSNGTSEFAQSLIGTLPITNAETFANGPTNASTSWNDTTNKQNGFELLDDDGELAIRVGTQFVATFIEEGLPDASLDRAQQSLLRKQFIKELYENFRDESSKLSREHSDLFDDIFDGTNGKWELHHRFQQEDGLAAWYKEMTGKSVHDADNLVMIPKDVHKDITRRQTEFWKYWKDKYGARNVEEVLDKAGNDKKKIWKAYQGLVSDIDETYGDVWLSRTASPATVTKMKTAMGVKRAADIASDAAKAVYAETRLQREIQLTRKFKNRKIPIKFGMVLSAFAATTTLLSIEACAEPGTPEHAALSTFATWYGKLYREFDTNGHPTEKTVSQFVDSLVDFLTAINAGNVLINSIQKIGLSLPTLWGASSN